MRRALRWLLAVAMTALGVTEATADDAGFYTVTYVECAPSAAAQAAALLRQYGETSRKDPGHVRVEVLQRLDRPGQFVVVAAWKDDKAFEAHKAAPSTTDLRDKLGPLLAAPNDERLHHGLSVATTPAPAGAMGAVYVVTHVDVIPPRKDDGVAALKRLAEDARKDPGLVRFDVVQQVNRPNHFTVVEVWADRKAFDTHVMAAHTRQFRERLSPMNGALYGERLYTTLK